MATVVNLPAAVRPSVKPSRSMTHPLRDPKGNGGRKKPKKGEPFDPEDLSRRLSVHLAEQKFRAEKRREAREAKAALALQNQPYVPKSAAAAFQRTATPDVMNHVHKLAQPALKSHLELLSLNDHPAPGHPSSLQRTQALDKAVLEKEMLRSRNQFQWNQDMQEASRADRERDLYRAPQRTFNSEFAHLRGTQQKRTPRPLSTGDAFWSDESEEERQLVTIGPRAPLRPANDGNDRHDWQQRDDVCGKKEKTSPFLKKMESSWMLMAKKEKVPARQGSADSGSPPDGKKSRFLARFKRHPS